ncbi:MAG: DUF2851 family protein [Pedobacter sp.]|nr:MAG: DUF2851 family protein [Pedobacter sp.]
MAQLSENFLFFIWQYRLFDSTSISCTNGQSLRIIHPGVINKHAGPDFTEAKVIIDGTTWVGNVEIHIKSSDWLLHKHHQNSAYESVILHVVYEDDHSAVTKSERCIATLVLKGSFSEAMLFTYASMLNSACYFPCKAQISQVDHIAMKSFLSRMLVERYEQKTAEVFQVLNRYKGDWNETFYYFLARNFGFKVNALPFELTAGSLPYQVLVKHHQNALQTEALLFGQAGFLEQHVEGAYPLGLQKEYQFLKHKYKLKPIEVSVWKFLRMRPMNFPTVRLAQFAALQQMAMHLFSKIIEEPNLNTINRLFENLPTNEYWTTHYHFGKSTKMGDRRLGAKSIENIMINTVCLFLFAYGKYADQEELIDRAMDFLEQIPAERNSIVTQYIESGVVVDSAFCSQSVLQLNKYYCGQKKCLNCGIGINLLKKDVSKNRNLF